MTKVYSHHSGSVMSGGCCKQDTGCVTVRPNCLPVYTNKELQITTTLVTVVLNVVLNSGGNKITRSELITNGNFMGHNMVTVGDDTHTEHHAGISIIYSHGYTETALEGIFYNLLFKCIGCVC